MIPTATVTLDKQGEPHTGAACGDGPVEACFNAVDAISLLTTHYDKVAENAGAHYQIIGLRDVDPVEIRAELKATGDDGIQVIARHMNYGLYRVEGKADCPRDALNICRMLSLKPEILAQIEQSY